MASKAQRGHLRLVETSDGERVETADDRDLRPSQPGDPRQSTPGDARSAAPAEGPLVSMRVPSRPDAEEVGHVGDFVPPMVARAASMSDGADAEASPLPHPHPHPVMKSSRLATRGPLANLPDAQLVALGCKGESGAFELLYRRHVSFALHLATRIEGSSRDVEDIVHDAFLRAFERINDLSDRGAFKSWLGAIVVHAVRSRMRRHRLMNLLGIGRKSEPVDLDSVMSPDASPHTRAQVAQIYALLRTLSADDRIAWTLRCVEGHDLDSVAKLTRCSLATVKRRISRAQQFLDEHFIDSAKENLS
jgi:RNA polymerase sigma-70 factor (ECF subfamily)